MGLSPPPGCVIHLVAFVRAGGVEDFQRRYFVPLLRPGVHVNGPSILFAADDAYQELKKLPGSRAEQSLKASKSATLLTQHQKETP